jgi:MFS family permease
MQIAVNDGAQTIGPLEQKHLKSQIYRNVCDPSKLTSTHWHVAISNGLGWAFDGMDAAILGLVTPLLMKEFALSLPEFRSGIQLFGLAAILGCFAWPWLADRYGRRTVLALNVALFSLLMPIAAAVPNWMMFIAIYAVIRFTLAGEWAVGAPLVVETWPAKYRGLVLGVNRSAYSLGIALAGLLATYVAVIYGWRGAFILPGIIALLAIYIRTLVPESPEWVRSQDRMSRIKAAVSRGGVVSADDREWFSNARRIPLRQLFHHDVIRKTVLVTTVYTLIVTSFTTITYFMPLFLSETHRWSTAEYGAFYTWWGFVGIPAYWIAGGLSDKVGRRAALVVCLLWAAVFLAIWAYTQDKLLLWILGMTWSFGYAGIYGPLASFTSEHFPTRIRSTGTGFALAMGVFVGTVLWPYVLVWLRETTGSFRAGFLVSAGILLLVSLIIWLFAPESPRKEVSAIVA